MAGQVRDTTEICPLVTQFVDSDETLTGLSSLHISAVKFICYTPCIIFFYKLLNLILFHMFRFWRNISTQGRNIARTSNT